jgi:NTP pyrophosphatase (non-canonical NTP hydrolase)
MIIRAAKTTVRKFGWINQFIGQDSKLVEEQEELRDAIRNAAIRPMEHNKEAIEDEIADNLFLYIQLSVHFGLNPFKIFMRLWHKAGRTLKRIKIGYYDENGRKRTEG